MLLLTSRAEIKLLMHIEEIKGLGFIPNQGLWCLGFRAINDREKKSDKLPRQAATKKIGQLLHQNRVKWKQPVCSILIYFLWKN